MKALAMIAAIEGLIPDRRLSRSRTQPAAPLVEPDIYASKWRREQQHQPVGEEPTDLVAAAETRPAAPQVHVHEPTPEPAPKPPSETSFPNLGIQPSPLNPFINPGSPNWVPDATGHVFDAVLDRGSSLSCPFPQINASLGRVAEVDKKPNFIEFYKISRSRDSSGAASAGRKIALHHRKRDRGQYSFGVGKTTQRKSKAHTPPFTQSVFSMHRYPMRERWASLASSAEFHEGSRTWPDGRILKLFRIGLPIIQAGSSDPKCGSIPKLKNEWTSLSI
jgi:hypothetical protein